VVRIEAADPKIEPNLQPLTVLHSVDLICHLWQQYVNMALLPLASASVTVRREMVVFNNQTVSRIEGAANQVMQKLTDSEVYSLLTYIIPDLGVIAILTWLSVQLAKQKRNDFKPRNDDLSFARVNTEPCIACCETLEKVRDATKENLSGKNLEVFLTEVGVGFHGYVSSI
jgi:exocyst complex component 5